jgi:transcriptional regulator with XRE-family HTH domain
MAALNRRFGLAVRQLREARGWSQEVFADRAGLSRSYAGEVERGNAVPSLATVLKVAAAFGISGAALIEHSEQAELRRPGSAAAAVTTTEK